MPEESLAEKESTEKEFADPTQSELSQIDDEAVSAASLSIEAIAVIPIAQLDKYVVTCEISGPIQVEDFAKIQKLAQNLDRWWRGDNKFFVLVQNDDIPKIRFERIETTDDELQ